MGRTQWIPTFVGMTATGRTLTITDQRFMRRGSRQARWNVAAAEVN